MADIAGGEIAIDHHLGGLVGPLPVSGHDLRTADADFAGLPDSQRMARRIDGENSDRGARIGKTDGAGSGLAFHRVAADDRRGFTQAIALDQMGSCHPLEGKPEIMGQGGTTRDAVAQRAKIVFSQVGRVEDGVEQRGHTGHARGLLLGDRLQKLGNLESGQQDYLRPLMHRPVHHHGHGEDMEQGQHPQHALRPLADMGEPARALLGVGIEIAMGQHRALGHAGRAPGVLQQGDRRAGIDPLGCDRAIVGDSARHLHHTAVIPA